MTNAERRTMMIMALTDSLDREINRMYATKDLTEVDIMYLHARESLGKLLQSLFNSKFKAESEE